MAARVLREDVEGDLIDDENVANTSTDIANAAKEVTVDQLRRDAARSEEHFDFAYVVGNSVVCEKELGLADIARIARLLKMNTRPPAALTSFDLT